MLLVILFILLSLYFYKQEVEEYRWKGYTPLVFKNDDDLKEAINLLYEAGYTDIVSLHNITLGVNDFFDLEERSLTEVKDSIDEKDYRFDSYIRSIKDLFVNEETGEEFIYLKMESNELIPTYKIYSLLSDKGISFTIGDTFFLRAILNYLTLFLLFILFGLGCRSRLIFTLIYAVLTFFFLDATSLYSYMLFVLIYFISIMVIESFSFSNRYIKRNNVGLFRVLLFISLYTIPTLTPSFIDYSNAIYHPLSLGEEGFSYDAMESHYNEEIPNISNYFTHYAFQKNYIYGYKYLFPTFKSSVTIDEFKREDFYLSRYKKEIETFDEAFFNDFITYCDSTVLGRFYLDYGRPFKLEFNSLISLYILENEYMQIALLAVLMLFASLFFRKGRDKKLKY